MIISHSFWPIFLLLMLDALFEQDQNKLFRSCDVRFQLVDAIKRRKVTEFRPSYALCQVGRHSSKLVFLHLSYMYIHTYVNFPAKFVAKERQRKRETGGHLIFLSHFHAQLSHMVPNKRKHGKYISTTSSFASSAIESA
jgi:hypothetical protein